VAIHRGRKGGKFLPRGHTSREKGREISPSWPYFEGEREGNWRKKKGREIGDETTFAKLDVYIHIYEYTHTCIKKMRQFNAFAT